MILYSCGSEHHDLSAGDILEGIAAAIPNGFRRRRILVVPPDITRYHSRAGEITSLIYGLYGNSVTDILPALGTHRPMTSGEISRMFPGVPNDLFRVHDWRRDVVRIGEVPGEYLSSLTGGLVTYSWPAELNRLIWQGGHDLVISVGQVVPHEVIGMANFNKNLFIGCGGSEGINKSHFLGAVYGMERIMGVADNPVRKVLNYASEKFLGALPVVYILTVQEQDVSGNPAHPSGMITRGLFIGTGTETFLEAAKLSVKVNINGTDQPWDKAVVYLDPSEYRSTWLGNKAIYRTRLAMADGGELIILAPGVKEFGEDPEIDRLIRKYGYHGTPATLDAVNSEPEMQRNLSAAAHLIHGSSEGRFRIRYCPGHLGRAEIERAGYDFGDLDQYTKLYHNQGLVNGTYPDPEGGKYMYVSNPATGLWGLNSKLK